MSNEQNRALVCRFLENVWNEGNWAAIEDGLATNFILHVPSAAGQPPGPAVYQQAVTRFRAAFPNLHTTIEDVMAEGDKVVIRGTDLATHRGEFMGIPATGKQVTVAWIGIYRVTDGKIAEEWGSMDSLGLLQQLGIMPSPEQSGK